jgi:hypothetical protein
MKIANVGRRSADLKDAAVLFVLVIRDLYFEIDQ